MKNWGKCLHESQTNIWDMCVCVCVCMWMMGGGEQRQSTSLSNSSAVEPPYSKIFHAPGHQKKKKKNQQKPHKSLSIDEITKKAFYPIRPHLLFP